MAAMTWAYWSRPDVLAGALAIGVGTLWAIKSWAGGGVNPHRPRLASGTVALVTGANTGIGLETVKDLVRLGAHVVMAGRNPKRLEAAMAIARDAAKEGGGSLETLVLDLSDRASVEAAARTFLARHASLDLLVNNAGIMYTVGREREETDEGFEPQFSTNVIGHALLTKRLLPALEVAKGGRIINVASRAHRWAPLTMFEDLQSKDWKSGAAAYGISKLGNMLHARGLNERLVKSRSRVRAYSVHPGAVRTELLRNSPGWLHGVAYLLLPVVYLLFKSPWQGAQTSLYLCLAPDEELRGGGYYADCAEARVQCPDGLWTASNAAAFLTAVEEMAETGKPMDVVPGASAKTS